MRSHWSIQAVLVMWIVAAVGFMEAAQTPTTDRLRVLVKVSAEDNLQGTIQQALRDELRRTPGWVQVDESPDYTLSVVALAVVQAQTNVGATLSVLITESYEERLRRFAEAHIQPELGASLAALMAGAVKPSSHWVETTSTSGIPAVCRNIVQSLKEVRSVSPKLTPQFADSNMAAVSTHAH